MKLRFVATLVFALGTTGIAFQNQGIDWPQWQGPDRTGLSKETGLLQQWPPSGPPLMWSVSGLGAGYGSLAIKGDRIFVQALSSGGSTVFSLNRADGKVVWTRLIGRGVD